MALGATPQQVYIDGIPQVENPVKLSKPQAFQESPKTPDFTKEADAAVEHRGLPPLKGKSAQGHVAFVNIRSTWVRDYNGQFVEMTDESTEGGIMQFNAEGRVACSSFRGESCLQDLSEDITVVDLEGGSLGPGLTSFGGNIGVMEIDQAWTTNDGVVFGPFDKEFAVVGDLIRAVDGISFEGRDML